MRINSINTYKAYTPAFSSKKPFDWANDPDFAPTPKDRLERVINQIESKKSAENKFDEEIERIFSPDKGNELDQVVLTVNIYDDKNPKQSNKITARGVAAVAACLLTLGSYAMSIGAISGGITRALKQNELKKTFKDSPEAVAQELINVTNMEAAAVNSYFNPTGTCSLSGVLTEDSLGDKEAYSALPAGPDSKITYGVENVITYANTKYKIALDIDGDDNPEISLSTDSAGTIEVEYDYDSDGTVDETKTIDALGKYLDEHEDARKDDPAGLLLLSD